MTVGAVTHARGVLAALAALVSGVLAAEHGWGSRPASHIVLALGALALVGAWFVDGRARVVVATVAFVAIGHGVMQRALDGLAEHSLVDAVAGHDHAVLDGTVVSDPDGVPFASEAYVRIGAVHRILVVRATGADAARLRAVEAGDRVQVEGRLAPLPRAGRLASARWRHAVGVLEETEIRAFAPPARGSLAGVANALRALVVRGTAPLAPTERALTTGFLLGDTRGVPDDVEDAYRASGLAHLLAVSGANVAFVLALAGPLLRLLPLGPRAATALCVVLVFAAMTRFEPSVLRASVLAAVSVGATFAGRPTAGLRALGLAVVVLLVADPFLVHSVGFVLSASASAGIVVLARPIAARLRGPAVVRESLSVSLAAQLGVTPVLLAVFGEVPVVTPISNLLAVPAADLLGVYAMVASALGGLWAPLGAVLQPVTALLVGWITLVARAGAAAGVEVDGRGVLVLLALPAVATVARRARRPVPAPAPR